MNNYVRYVSSDDWSALYIDGKLDTVGDHYLIDERISALLGVTRIDSDAFMQGQIFREGVAQTLAEIEQYENTNETQKEIEELEKDIAHKQETLQRLRAK